MSINIFRKPVIIEIEGKEYDFILDFESAIVFQDLYGKSIFVGIDKITKEQDLKALSCLIASCLKDPDTFKCVGMNFVKKIDLISGLPFFTDRIADLLTASLPENKEENKKKQKQKTT